MYFYGTIKQTRLREFCKKYSVLQVRLSFFSQTERACFFVF